MAGRPSGRKKTTKGRKLIGDPQERAILLSHAATFGVSAAAKEFGLNRKTIQRYQAELNSGSDPELSRLVAAESDKARERNRSKLHRALDAFLDRALALAPSADLPKVLDGITRIGDLVTKRDVFLGDNGELDGRDRGDAPDEGPGGTAAQGARPEAPAVR
jgi:hypothetical protein